MQSSDEAALRITPELLQKLVTVVDVDDLSRSGRDAWHADSGLASRMSAEFGTAVVPIVQDGEVVYGWDAVEVEQNDQRDGGRMMVIDITGLDWPQERVWALVAALHRRPELITVDQHALADLLLDISKSNQEWLDAAGWDTDALTDLLAQINAPTLAALTQQHGEFTDADNREFWPWIKVQVSPDTYRHWTEAMDDAPGRDDSERVEYILSGGEE